MITKAHTVFSGSNILQRSFLGLLSLLMVIVPNLIFLGLLRVFMAQISVQRDFREAFWV